jgi:transcriptional regulator with XRE-family HTH domain
MSNFKQKSSLKSVANLDLGTRIKRARQAVGLSQLELGRSLKLSDKTVSAYEVGRTQPSLEALQDLSRVTHKSVSYFVGQRDSENLDLEIRIKKIEQELLEIKRLVKAGR